MATREQIYKATILINSEQAVNNVKKLEVQLDNVKKRRDKALAEGKIDVWKAANKEVDDINRKLEKQRSIVLAQSKTIQNISTAKAKELKTLIGQINKELDSPHIKKGSQEWHALVAVMKDAKKELKEITEATKEHQSVWKRFTGFLNTNWGAITQIVAAFSGLRDVIRGSVEAFSKMDQEMNNVRKYTGQSIDEVERMNEMFKKMDTRTPREQLNQLAGSAGRLGITSTKSVMEFVDAADKINVALGDDLGDGAVDKIGKLAMAFGEDDRMGLRGAMMATGSAVNELAQNSAAQAGYLVDFAARLSGVGVQAGLTQAQILGIGAAMDENMQRDEMAATAISQLITKMTTDSAKFARIAGKDIEEFSRLVKEDMNAALMELFEAMNKKGGFAELAPLFGEMGLDGSRAIGVLSILASKIKDVQKHQELATKAYKEGTSVMAEFNIQNNTYQAKLEKARKAFGDLRIELGEKLLPVASAAIGTTGIVVKVLSTLISFVLKAGATIISLGVTIAALTAYRYKDIIATKLQVFWNETLIAGTKRLWATIKANPYAVAALAVAAFVGVVIDLVRRTNEATAAQKALASVEHDAAVKAEMEKQKIELLQKKIHDNNLSLEERRKHITELQKIVPDYIAKISDEGRVYEESTEALDKYIQKIKEKAMADGARAKLEELSANKAELVVERMRKAEEMREQNERRQRGQRGAIAGSVGFWSNQSEDAVVNAAGNSILKSLDKKIEDADKAIELMSSVAGNAVAAIQDANGGESPVPPGSPTSPTGGSGSKSDPYKDDLKVLETAYKAEQLALKKHLAEGLITEQQYQDLSYDAEMQHLAKKVSLQEKYGQDSADTQIKMLDMTMNMAKEAQRRSAQAMRDELSALDKAYASDQTELMRMRVEGVIASDAAYKKRMLELEKDFQEQKLAIIRKYGGDVTATEKDILNDQLKNLEDFEKRKKQAWEKAYKNASTVDDQREIAREMYEQQIIDFEDYQERMTDIEKREQERRRDIRQQFFDLAKQLLSSASSYAQACSDLETAEISANYDRQIEAAGKNTKKREKLEKERDEKLRKAKTKSNERAMRIEIAQAIASTASNALSAFGAVLQPQMPWTVPLAYAAAAAATVSGLVQVAAIKKQHQAEAAGYYEGGFTGGQRYKRVAGVVHEGEFVANHQAVNNQQLMPLFDLIDRAQRNNTVGSLTMQDVSRSMGGSSQVVAPIVNVQTDNEDLREELARVRDSNDMLIARLQQPINAQVVLTGPDGLNEQQERLNNMLKNK